MSTKYSYLQSVTPSVRPKDIYCSESESPLRVPPRQCTAEPKDIPGHKIGINIYFQIDRYFNSALICDLHSKVVQELPNC